MKGAPSNQEHPLLLKSWTVSGGKQAIRFDAFLHHRLPHLSLREIRRAIEEKAFCVNDRPGKKGTRLFVGDVVTLRGSPHLLAQSPLPGTNLKVPILYEDASVLVLDKPAGMPTHGFSGRETNTLANFLAANRPSLCSLGRSRWEPGLVHRLDRDTSGILLVAKTPKAFEHLRSQFRCGLIKKRYWTVVLGKTNEEQIVNYPLTHDRKDPQKMKVVMKKGLKQKGGRRWNALTRFRTLGYSQGYSLLQVEISTGVTHQIRVHLESIGHPLVGDPLYGRDQPDPFGLGRQLLHAFHLGFCHPVSGRNMAVESPLPATFKMILNRLEIYL
ncbi:MAG: RluA family pseudouridine synthase [Candidatus Binatia bacterium]